MGGCDYRLRAGQVTTMIVGSTTATCQAMRRRFRFALGGLVILLTLVTVADVEGGDDTPLADPDFAAIARAAQRTEVQTDYIVVVPTRRAECATLAQTYLSTGTTTGAGIAAIVEFHCVSAILRKLAELYYDPESFPPDGMNGLIDRLGGAVYDLYDGIYNKNPRCRPACGTMYLAVPRFAVTRAIEDAIESVAEARLAGNPAAWPKWQEDWRNAIGH